jgi:hypothetical protein
MRILRLLNPKIRGPEARNSAEDLSKDQNPIPIVMNRTAMTMRKKTKILMQLRRETTVTMKTTKTMTTPAETTEEEEMLAIEDPGLGLVVVVPVMPAAGEDPGRFERVVDSVRKFITLKMTTPT